MGMLLAALSLLSMGTVVSLAVYRRQALLAQGEDRDVQLLEGNAYDRPRTLAPDKELTSLKLGDAIDFGVNDYVIMGQCVFSDSIDEYRVLSVDDGKQEKMLWLRPESTNMIYYCEPSQVLPQSAPFPESLRLHGKTMHKERRSQWRLATTSGEGVGSMQEGTIFEYVLYGHTSGTKVLFLEDRTTRTRRGWVCTPHQRETLQIYSGHA